MLFRSGKTLAESNCLFKIFARVTEESAYLRANESTKSELVIKILDPAQCNVSAVLNLESDKESDFCFLDGLVFSLITAWQEDFRNQNTSADKRLAIIRKVSEVFQAVREITSDENERVACSYSELLQHFIQYDALSIALSASKTHETKTINIPYCKGYAVPSDYKKWCIDNISSFPYHVLVSGEPQEVSIELDDNYDIKKHRKSAEYAAGA